MYQTVKLLKQLAIQSAFPHRAKATVLMRGAMVLMRGDTVLRRGDTEEKVLYRLLPAVNIVCL